MSYIGSYCPVNGRVLNLVVGLSFSGGTMLCPCASRIMLYLVLVQPRKRPDMTENVLTGM